MQPYESELHSPVAGRSSRMSLRGATLAGRLGRGARCGKPLVGSGFAPSFYGKLAGQRPTCFRPPAESVAKHREEGFPGLP